MKLSNICICGKETTFISKSKGYRQYCSRKCMYADPKTAEKRKATMLEKYGVDSYSKIQEFKPWSEETKKNFNSKTKATMLEKYGVEHSSKRQNHNDIVKKTMLEKYGVENGFHLVKDKFHFFSTEKGKEWLHSDDNLGGEYFKKYREDNLLEKVNDPILVDIIINKDGESFKSYIHNIAKEIDTPDRFSISKNIGLSTSYLNYLMRQYDMSDDYISSYGISNGENEVADFITSLGFNIKRNDRSLLNGKEIDILIDGCKLGIEFNGVYWHSEGAGKDKQYHVEKTNLMESNGYQLLHIYDVEWNDDNKREIWKSIIRAKLNKIDNKIYARNCHTRKIDSNISRAFLTDNHLEGFVGAKYHFGLYEKDKLVSVISFGKSRFKSDEYEIIRFASLKNHIIIGAYSKLLKCYTLQEDLISYANRRFSTILIPNKFAKNYSIIEPNWYGYNKNDYELKHRLSFTKKNLQKLFKYSEDLTAYENMLENGYDRIWDSGNIKYKMN